MDLFHRSSAKILNFILNTKDPKKPKQSWKEYSKKNKPRDLTLLDFKQHCKAIVIKAVQVLAEKHTDEWNRIQSPELNLHIYEQVIFEKEPRIYNGEKNISLTNGVGKTGHQM